eukprot:Gregarina_sp_Poly_1__7640@NODE_429_length_8553_cov_130_002239_g350_i0_p6_GENE_NODE_429_length_8553_cov_130_002239_g350_i0NODE_429_length_8553_cov_130_002239_g350_i0_p6_ORF_typecomplete_len149_score10_21DUF3042/PF11240_8/0_011TMEM154/PF15102_6/0_013CD34_antigen/PF06365_12/0_039DUF3592/PF12158_8/0_11zfHYPF/PF07503_12/1_9zfHYPF/PF07503_12/55ABC_membrane_3/PF13748_6/0_14DUF3482/PF11981_8/0_16Syndecan/PF01034_20/0_29Podoplanin/PF05808_11/0_22DUF3808/PF10300_9/0_22_NODE_429_length_8553_cov_130_002239_
MQLSAAQIVVICLGVLGTLLTVAAVVLVIHKRRTRKFDEQLEARVISAEQQRLDALLQFYQHQTPNGNGALWTYQPLPNPQHTCPHGLPVPPADDRNLHAALVGTCPTCFPQFTLAYNDIVTFQHMPRTKIACNVCGLVCGCVEDDYT